jgi:hypothetical protein
MHCELAAVCPIPESFWRSGVVQRGQRFAVIESLISALQDGCGGGIGGLFSVPLGG